MALPMKPEAAPLSSLGHSTTCNLLTMNTHTHTHTHTYTHTHKHTYNLFLFGQSPLLDVEFFLA